MNFIENKAVHASLFESLSDLPQDTESYGNNTALKPALIAIGKFLPDMCGDDIDLRYMIEKLLDYANYPLDAHYDYQTESVLLTKLFDQLYRYEDTVNQQQQDVDKAINTSFKNVDRNNISADISAADRNFLLAREAVYNSMAYTICISYFLETMITGFLPVPNAEEQKAAYYGQASKSVSASDYTIYIPVFPHLPVPEDITDKAIGYVKGFEGFRDILMSDYEKVIGMLGDNCDGNVWVRLFKDGKPILVKVNKFRVFLVWVLQMQNECLWTGLVKEAMETAGIDYENASNSEFAKICFGPDYEIKKINEDDISQKSLVSAEMIYDYAAICYELYARLLITATVLEETDEDHAALCDALRGLIIALPTFIGYPQKLLAPYLNNLKNGAEKYIARHAADDNDQRMQQRLSACKNVLRLCERFEGTEENSKG